MPNKRRVTLENAYWSGGDIYSEVKGTPYLVDSGAEVSMTRKPLKTKGYLSVLLADDTLRQMPYGVWEGIVWVVGPNNLLTTQDLAELQKPKNQRKQVGARIKELLKSRAIRISAEDKVWYKPVDIPEETEKRIKECDFSKEGKEKLREILAKARSARFKNDCGLMDERYTHVIKGGVHAAVRQYPLNPGAVAEMDIIIKELLALGIIRDEPNPITNSPIQAVKKPESAGGGWRPVVNYKALNKRTVANKASVINPQGTLKTLRVRTYKSCIDLANGFFSMPLAKASQGKTAFTHKGRSFVYCRLPQGFKNSPTVFQSAIMDILGGIEASVYIDDVFIADDSEEEHLVKLQEVVGRLTKAGLKLNLKKCQLGKFEVNYLGFQVSTDLGLSDGYKEKLARIEPPKTRRDLQSALGLCNYVRDHVEGYQKYARPLYARLKKDKNNKEGPKGSTKINWTAEDQENLENLRKAINTAVRLEPRSLDSTLEIEIFCDHEDAIVKLRNEGGGLVALWSWTLPSVERKYTEAEKELAVLAKYWKHLKELAQGQIIRVFTQSRVNRFLKKDTIEGTRATNTRWGRWEDLLLDPDLEFVSAEVTKPKAKKGKPEEDTYDWCIYTDGSKKNWDKKAHWAYVLYEKGKEVTRQRGQAIGTAQTGEVTAVLEGLLELEKRRIKKARLVTDSFYCYQALKEDLEIWQENEYEGAKGKEVSHRDLWEKIAELQLCMTLDVQHQRAHKKEGAYWQGNDEVDRFVQMRRIILVGSEKWEESPRGRVIPTEQAESVVQAIHENQGHAGIYPTRQKMEQLRIWTPEKTIREVLKNCTVCGQYNAGRRGQRVGGQSIKSTVPWGSICMDVAGPLGINGKKGEKYLLVLVDSMSGFAVVEPVKKANGGSVTRMLDRTCAIVGLPKELRTDNGSHFRNAQVDRWCQENGIIRVYSPPYTPQANGVVERTIGLVKGYIAKNANGKEWSTCILKMVEALNNRPREGGRPSPSQELNQRPFRAEEVGRKLSIRTTEPHLKVPFRIGQRVWVKARYHTGDTAVKAKYEKSDTVVEILDSNTVRLKKAGLQGVEQLKPIF